jgi:hypothetical protein
MNATFRLRRSYLVLGVLCTLFFAAMAVVSVLGIYFEAPPERRAAALAVGLGMAAFWLAFMGLGVWVLLAYWRERLTLRDGEVDWVRVIRRKRMRASEIVSARWRCGQKGGSLVLRTTSTKLPIYFSNYEAEEQRQLIRFFREAVSPPLQQDWERFCARIVKGRSQHVRQLRKPEAGEGEVLLTRRRLDAYFLPGMLLAVATCVYVYHVTGDASLFLKLFAIPAIWLVVRFMLPRKGAVSNRLTSDARGRFVLFAYLSLFGGMVVLLVLKALVPNAALAFMIPFFVIPFAVIFVWARRLDRRQRREEQEAIEQIRREGQLLPEEITKPWS